MQKHNRGLPMSHLLVFACFVSILCIGPQAGFAGTATTLFEATGEIVWPPSGTVFIVPRETPFIDVRAEAHSLISYRAETGPTTGDDPDLIRCEWSISIDGEKNEGHLDMIERDDFNITGTFYTLFDEEVPLHVTKTCGVGYHVINMSHKVINVDTTVVVGSASDMHDFWVVPAPLPPASYGAAAVLVGCGFVLWRQRRRLAQDDLW